MTAAAPVITRFVRVSRWKDRLEVAEMGDVSGLVAEPPVYTVLSGRAAVVRAWFDEATGDGFEQIEIRLNAGEV